VFRDKSRLAATARVADHGKGQLISPGTFSSRLAYGYSALPPAAPIRGLGRGTSRGPGGRNSVCFLCFLGVLSVQLVR